MFRIYDHPFHAEHRPVLPREHGYASHGHGDGQESRGAARFVIEDNHDERRDDGIEEMERRGHARGHVGVAVEQEERRTVGNESQVGERDHLATRHAEADARWNVEV